LLPKQHKLDKPNKAGYNACLPAFEEKASLRLAFV
jgi:hypothetical protein